MLGPLILIVARDEHLASLMVQVLQRAGWSTLTANLAQEARDRFTGDVELLLTDCNLADSSGEELAFYLLNLKSSLRVCFMSGGLPATDRRIPLLPGVNFIQRPFGAETLVSFIKTVLTRAPE
ncbi:MAG: multi-sensor hybrid histidine kinase [Verrucomicrobiales bacterium]|nr:multi-sensor hybrid histidine kinase [Verrucomicrobiales bacterium]